MQNDSTDSTNKRLYKINSLTSITGNQNVFSGTSSTNSVLTSGNNSVGVGYNTLSGLTTGSGNTAVGSGAAAAVNTGNYNTAVGYSALNIATGVTGNTAIGYGNLIGSTSNYNTSVGYSNITSVSGIGNTALGLNNFSNHLVSGAYNTSIGVYNFYGIATALSGSYNSSFGYSGFTNLTTGSYNIGLGTNVACIPNGVSTTNVTTTGSYNTFLGYQTGQATSTQVDSSVAIGKNAVVTSSNQMALGGSGADALLVGIDNNNPTSKFVVSQSVTGIGTVSNSAAGTTVTGLGTKFLDTFKVGQAISIGGQTVVISAIASNTSMTTASITATNSNINYTVPGFADRFYVRGNGDIFVGSLTGILKATSGVISGSSILNDIGSPTSSFSMNNQNLTNISAASGSSSNFVVVQQNSIGVVDLSSSQTIQNKVYRINEILANNLTAEGMIYQHTAGENLAFGDTGYYKSDGKIWKADATSATANAATVMSLGTTIANATGLFLKQGSVRNDSWNWVIGGKIYQSKTTGALVQDVSTYVTGDMIQIIGYAFPNAKTIVFNPSLYVTNKP